MAKLKLDLHEIYSKGYQIDAELNRIVEEALIRKSNSLRSSPAKVVDSSRKKSYAF